MFADQEKLALLALHLTPGIGDYLLKQLIAYCGSPGEVFKQSKAKLLKIPDVGEKTVEAVRLKQHFSTAEKEIRKAEKENATIVTYLEPAYPQRLRDLNDAPAVLFCKGAVNLNHPKIVAIVGTRQATAYGKEVTEKLVAALAPHQPVILSGLAYGIDIAAHKEALRQRLPTIAVLGSGLDVIYPAAHRDAARKMEAGGGALISENRFGTQPDAHNFPARNRIIAGLCDALIVVEAAAKGGALITANIANSYQKDVFAVPGALGATFSEGCNWLIKTNQAHLLQSAADVEYILNWRVAAVETTPPEQLSLALSDPTEAAVVQALQNKSSVSVDELAAGTGLAPGALATALLSLEMQNKIIPLPGKRFRLKGRPA
jgi:DNA processing protein